MLDKLQIGYKIKKLREENKMSQEDLANILFMSRQAISKWETGAATPNIEFIIELSKLFNTSIDEILCLNEKPIFDSKNIFASHSREYVINSIINGIFKVDIINIFSMLNFQERIIIIKAINSGNIICDTQKLSSQLSISEQKLLIIKKGELK
jgi:transcriptional regulator with XRE-family HTH domain